MIKRVLPDKQGAADKQSLGEGKINRRRQSALFFSRQICTGAGYHQPNSLVQGYE